MAATEQQQHGDSPLSRKLGPLPVWAWAAVGVAIALYYSRSRKKAAGGAGSPAPSGYSPLAQEQAAALAGSSMSSYYPTGYSDASSGADLTSVLEQLSGQISALGGGNSGTNKSPAPSPGNTQTGGANQTSPAPGPLGGIPGYMMVRSPQEGSAYDAAGYTIYVLPAGATPSAGSLIPWVVKGKVVNNKIPPKSTQYIKVGG